MAHHTLFAWQMDDRAVEKNKGIEREGGEHNKIKDEGDGGKYDENEDEGAGSARQRK